MLKLPSPSVVCAQNSPVILMTGLTRSGQPRSRRCCRDMRAAHRRYSLPYRLWATLPSVQPIPQSSCASRGIGLAQSGAASMMCQRFRSRSVSVSVVHRLLDDAVSFALVHLERANLIDQVINHVAHVQRVQHAHAEVDARTSSPGSPLAALIPSVCWKSKTRNPSKPAFCRANRYSASYMPKRHGPQEPAVKNT